MSHMVRPTIEKWGPASDLFVDHDRAMELFTVMGATTTYDDDPSEGTRVYFESAATMLASLQRPDEELVAELEDLRADEREPLRWLLDTLRTRWTPQALAPFIDEDGSLTLLVDW